MRTHRTMMAAVSAVALAAGLSACGTPYSAYDQRPVAGSPGYPYATAQTQAPMGVEYGRVTEVAMVRPATSVSGAGGSGNTAGSLLGAVVGGVVGNQIGSGGGRAAATILGAVGGAALGSRIGSNNQPSYATSGPVYRVSVQTDSGRMLTYDVTATGDLRPGDRVRIENGVIYLA